MKRAAGFWWLVVTAVCLLGGVALSAVGWLPFESVKGLADGLSPDGNFKVLTPFALDELRLPLRLGGVCLLLALVGLLAFRRKTQPFLSKLGPALRELPGELHELARIFVPRPGERHYLLGLLLVTAGAVLARLLFTSDPMVHDETYTYIAFAARPWWDLLSDYHLPNNHIFHTILVKLCTETFGMQPWAVRLPALVTGVLCVPAAYWLGKRFYSRPTGLLAAGLLAALPTWIDYNTNARGYSPQALFSLLVFGLAIYLREHKNRAGWLLFAGLGALGLFTLPVFVYPFGMTLAWLVISTLVEGAPAYGGRGRLLIYVGVFAALTVLLAAVCYLPVVMGSGLDALIANPYVQRLSAGAFFGRLGDRLGGAWYEWNKDLPSGMVVILALGFVGGLILHSRVSRVRIPAQMTTLAWLALALLLQRPDPNARLWTFLIPFWLVWSAAGLVEGARLLRIPPRWRAGLLGLALLGLALFSYQRTLRYFPSLSPGPGDVETIALYLQPLLEPGDGVVITSDDGPALWYYLRLHGTDDRYYVQQLDERVLQRAFILVNESVGQTLQSAADDRGLENATFDFAGAQRLTRIGGTTIYLCEVGYNR